MKNSKIRLPYKLCLLFSILYSFLVLGVQLEKTHYQEGPITLKATICSYQTNGDQLKLEVQAKEKIEVLYYYSTLEERDQWTSFLQFGANITIHGTLVRPKQPSNFHLFSYTNYLRSKKIHYQLMAEKIEFQTKTPSFLYQRKNQIWNHFQHYSSRTYLKLFLFGDKSEVDPQILEQYQRCGISHLMVISGMHVSFLIACCTRLFGSPKKLVVFVPLSCFLFFYAFLTGFTPSILRTVLFFLMIHGSFFLKLKSSNLELFLLLTSGFLFFNPYYWYHVGFLFSFLITFTLLWVGEEKSRHYFRGLARTSWIAFLISLPIVINQFSDVNLLSPLYNLFFVPLVTFLIFPLALITLFLPVVEPLFQLTVDLLNHSSAFVSTIPSIVSFRALSHLETILAFFLLFWILAAIKKKSYWRCFFLPLFFLLHFCTNTIVPKAKLVLFDVGQGDAILLQYQGHAVLIDTGGIVSFPKEAWRKKKKDNSLAQSILIPYLKAEGIHALDALFLTHGDFDHAGEARNLITSFPVKQVFFNQGATNTLEASIQSLLIQKHIPFRSLGRECVTIAKQEFCSWNEGNFQNENDNSLILDTKLKGKHILLMGDASSKTEQHLLAYFPGVVDILKVGHHGSDTSTSKSWIQTVKPKIALISVGKKNRYGHPSPSTIETLNHQVDHTYLTSIHGMIEINFKQPMNIKTCF